MKNGPRLDGAEPCSEAVIKHPLRSTFCLMWAKYQLFESAPRLLAWTVYIYHLKWYCVKSFDLLAVFFILPEREGDLIKSVKSEVVYILKLVVFKRK